MRIAYQTTASVVFLATPCHLPACTLTGRLDRHWFRRRHFSFYNMMMRTGTSETGMYDSRLGTVELGAEDNDRL